MTRLPNKKLARVLVRLAVPALALSLTACGNLNSIFRTTMLDSGYSPITGAKQRLISNTTADVRNGRNHPQRILCTEPSPDVAQALSTAASIAAKKGEASAAGAVSSAEGVVQLGERLATIQLLRDGLYRACEAYHNGAISQTMYALIVSRSDRVAVALLSSEMAAGAFGRKLAAISGSARSAAGQGGDPAKLAEAENELATEQGELNKLTVNREKLSVDRRALAGQEGKETETANLTNEINAVDGQIAMQRPKVEAAQKKVDRADTAFASTFASALATAGGGIAGRGPLSDASAQAVVRIHKQYSDSSPVGPLMVACVHALSTSYNGRGEWDGGSKEVHGQETELTKVCKGLFDPRGKKSSPFMKMLVKQQHHKRHMARIDNDAKFYELQSAVASGCVVSTEENKKMCEALARAVHLESQLRQATNH